MSGAILSRNYLFFASLCIFIVSGLFSTLRTESDYRRGLTYFMQGRFEQAEDYLQRALDGEDADRAALELVRFYARNDRWDEVPAMLGRIEDDSLQLRAYYEVARISADNLDRNRAIDYIFDGLEGREELELRKEGLLLLAVNLEKNQDYQAALSYLYELIEQYPESVEAADAHYFLARIYSRPGPYHNPGRSRSILRFLAESEKESYTQSIYQDRARHLLDLDFSAGSSFYD